MNKPEIACGGFIVPCCQSSWALEFIETSFDLIAQSIDIAINRFWIFPVRARWNDRTATVLSNGVANMVWIVSFVCDEDFGIRSIGIVDDVKAFVIRHFAAGYLCSQRQAGCVGDEVDLGRKATFWAAKTLFLSPPLAPAAWWWARIIVLSIIWTLSGAISLSLRTSSINSQSPESVQRRNCL